MRGRVLKVLGSKRKAALQETVWEERKVDITINTNLKWKEEPLRCCIGRMDTRDSTRGAINDTAAGERMRTTERARQREREKERA